jgi:hypothetical protein
MQSRSTVMSDVTVQRLSWQDPIIATLAMPRGTLTLLHGFGSGLATRRGDPPGRIWAIGDRGPNIKVGDAIALYGLDALDHLAAAPGAKIMPRRDIGPTLAELQVSAGAVSLLRMVPLTLPTGEAVSGLANPGSDDLLSEPVFDLAGQPIAPDPHGLDTEGVVALADGGFWVGDEFGPSLVRVDADGVVRQRLLPCDAGGESLPAIAAKRQLNRGFEALAVSDDEQWLFLAFQSPLAHPAEAAHKAAGHVRIWQMDLREGPRVTAQFAYPLDPPESFRRDCDAGPFDRSDIKVSELLWSSGSLLVLERGSATTKIYRCVLKPELALDAAHVDVATRPTLEELSARGTPGFPELEKQLLFTSDDHPDVGSDLEGMAWLSDDEVLLVSDNDFGVEGATTGFWRVRLGTPPHHGFRPTPAQTGPQRSTRQVG